jgi:hypothetical protein
MHAFCHAGYVPEQAAPPTDGARRRRRGGLVAVVTATVLPLAGPSAVLAQGGTPAAGAPTAGIPATERVHCTIDDPRLAELSGLVVVQDRLLALNDGGSRLEVLVLDDTCAVVDVRTADVDPYDPEDLALGAEGTIWIADTGDNGADRTTVALHALRADGTADLYRLTYPDGPHDAEALLLAPDGTPYLVTKEVLGVSGVYRPAAELVDGGTVALEEVASVEFTLTGTTGGPVGRAGQLMVTGGAVSGDGRLLALRTYTDAYLWTLDGSDVPAALEADPIRVALPESPQGEAISFGADHRGLVVASEGSPSDVVIVPTEQPLAPVAEKLAEPPAPAAPGLFDGERSPLTSAVIAAAVAAIAVWLGGKLRRRPE